jgi:hypothetical protein
MKSSARQVFAAPRRKARGQAVIWLMGTMVACAAILYGVFNTAQMTVAKQRTVNAADAGALAGATVQARVLNLAAYNNRSMMANEAFLIQLLSIESWLQYFGTTANNFGTVADIVGLFIPPVEAIGKILDELADVAEEIHDTLVDVTDVVIPIIEAAKTAIGAAHAVVIKGGGLLAEDAATKIVEANRTEFKTHSDIGVEIDKRAAVRAATFALNETQWLEFTTQYTDDKRGQAKQVLLDSRDHFSADRPGKWYLNINAGFAGTEKRGGSQLKDFDQWETQDTLELWEKVPCKSGTCKEYQPIGWGRSNADKDGSSGDVWSPTDRWANKLAHSDATSHGGNSPEVRNWSGVPSVYDLKDQTKENRAKLGVDFFLAARKSRAAVLTTQQIGMGAETVSPTGSGHMNERLEADQYTALAKARVFFERPVRSNGDPTASPLWRADSAKEYGSLYSPYWQARLTDLTATEKAGLITAMGMLPDKALYTPGGQD